MPKPRRKSRLVNHRGRPVGEDHHMAKLSNEEVALILYLRSEGLSYGAIAKKFDDKVTVSKSHVRWICLGLRRLCT